MIADELGKKRLRNGVGIVEGMHDISCLVLNGFQNLLIDITDTVYRNTAVEIKISFSVLVVEVHVLGTFSDEVKTLISFDHVFSNHIF